MIGSGFGGLFGAKALKRSDVDVTMVAKTTHHLFQPLLYQVATGILSEGEIAPPTREVLARQKNAKVLLGEVTDIDLEAQTVTSHVLGRETVTPYDSLIVAAGSSQSYFGNDQFAEFAPGMKSIDDALELRGRIFGAFELAELGAHARRERRRTCSPSWSSAPARPVSRWPARSPSCPGAPSSATSAPSTRARPGSSSSTPPARCCRRSGPSSGSRPSGRWRSSASRCGSARWSPTSTSAASRSSSRTARVERIESVTKIWAAGVQANALTKTLSEQTGAPLDRAGRIGVNSDLTLPGHPEVFVVGDMIDLDHLPGVAQVAIQGAKYAAKAIDRRLAGKPPQKPFKYFDKGSLATISRFRAVALIGSFRLTGVLAWLLWLAVHLLYLTGFKNRVTAPSCTGRSPSWAGAGRSGPRPSSRSSAGRRWAGSTTAPPTWSRRPDPSSRPRPRRPAGPSSRRSPPRRRGSPTPASAECAWRATFRSGRS